MAREEIQVGIETTYDDKGAKEAIADAQQIESTDPKIEVTADVSAVTVDLGKVRGDLDQTAEKADDTARHLDRIGGDPGGGLKTRGNAIADLTGPLGEASSAASDFAGVFDGIGDIAEDVAGKMGLSSDMTGKLVAALSGAGIAVAGIAAGWQLYQSRVQAAKKHQEEMTKAVRDFNKAVEEGDVSAAVDAFNKIAPKAIDLADDYGVSLRQITDYITGASDELPALADTHVWGNANDLVDSYREAWKKSNETVAVGDDNQRRLASALGVVEKSTTDATIATDDLAKANDNLKKKIDPTITSLNLADAELQGIRHDLDIESAINDFGTQMAEMSAKAHSEAGLASADVLAVKQSILDVAEAANLNPVDVKTAIEAVDQGDIDTAWFITQSRINSMEALKLQTKLVPPPNLRFGRGVIGLGPDGEAIFTSATNVTVNVPRGFQGDVLSVARDAARRTGGLYQRNRR